VPQLLKAGFFIGGSGGSGVLLSYDPGSNSWSSPSFLTMGSGSLGLQIGAEASEIVLVIMNEKGMEAVVKNKFTLGGDASVAVGPLGAGAKAATTTNIGADVYSFAKSKGLFGGIALEGAVLQPSAEANKAYYGSDVTPIQIVVERKVTNPGAASLDQALLAAQAKGRTETQ
ncbi:MAG: lipid-binding SYLF domain-containing protein, partial [Pseudomonadota bacterium]